MAATETFSDQIIRVVSSWPGVVVDDGEIGELSFKVGRGEIGHLHGDHAAHFSFPKTVWQRLHSEGRVEHHPVFPGKVGPAARRIADGTDVQDVIELLRINYERRVARASA
jgi:hypothetical protein